MHTHTKGKYDLVHWLIVNVSYSSYYPRVFCRLRDLSMRGPTNRPILPLEESKWKVIIRYTYIQHTLYKVLPVLCWQQRFLTE